MILGICFSFPKMGSSLNSYVTPKLASSFAPDGHYMNVAGPIFVGSLLMSISLILAKIDIKIACSFLAYSHHLDARRSSLHSFP